MAADSAQAFVFRAPEKHIRRLPDPNGEPFVTYEFRIRARDLPPGLPYDPNARPDPNLRKLVPKKIAESLMSGDGFFHLKNQGIKILANRVVKNREGLVAYLKVEGEGDEEACYGIADGGHTYAVIRNAGELVPDNQYVEVRIETGIPPEMIPEISAGLNTNQQVQEVSLANLAGEFEWLKEHLEDEPFYADIAWHEGGSGDIEVRELLGYLTAFHIGFYPTKRDGQGPRLPSEQPVEAYDNKRRVLAQYRTNRESFLRLKPILKEILHIRDAIEARIPDAYAAFKGSKASLHTVAWAKRYKSPIRLPFTGLETQYRVYAGALLPILAAFRFLVTQDAHGDYVWDRPFTEVLSFVDLVLPDLVELTAALGSETSRAGRPGVPDAIGKSRQHWLTLIDAVERKDLYRERPRRHQQAHYSHA